MRYGKNTEEMKRNLSISLLGEDTFHILENKYWLYNEYVIKRRTKTSIAKELNVSITTISDRLNKYNIESRGNNGRIKTKGEILKISMATKEAMKNPIIKNKISNVSKKRIGYKNGFYGKKHSEETKKIMSEKKKKLFLSKNNHPMYGRNHSIESIEKMKLQNGENHPNWKGGVTKNNIPLYDTYVHQIEYAEQVRRNKEDKNILEVKCTYCGKWYIPRLTEIRNRINVLNGNKNHNGEQRLYCSPGCKKECPIFHKIKYSTEENNSKRYSREVQTELRQMVFERDNWKCQRCENMKLLHCHHITGVELNPIESADIDNCITLCKKCHKEVHKKEGCKYIDLKKDKC